MVLRVLYHTNNDNYRKYCQPNSTNWLELKYKITVLSSLGPDTKDNLEYNLMVNIVASTWQIISLQSVICCLKTNLASLVFTVLFVTCG